MDEKEEFKYGLPIMGISMRPGFQRSEVENTFTYRLTISGLPPGHLDILTRLIAAILAVWKVTDWTDSSEAEASLPEQSEANGEDLT